MKIAVIGSPEPDGCRSCAVSADRRDGNCFGGARGVDTSAREYAHAHGLSCVEFLPDYAKYGRSAPLRRNLTDY